MLSADSLLAARLVLMPNPTFTPPTRDPPHPFLTTCRYVYERLTPPGQKPTFMTLMVTQLVSGVWHGLYPGYIMFFAGGWCSRGAGRCTCVPGGVWQAHRQPCVWAGCAAAGGRRVWFKCGCSTGPSVSAGVVGA